MSRPSTPPGVTEEVVAKSALVVAPHFDDEVLGCGGLVARLAAAGAEVRVLFLSDGGAEATGHEERAALSERRRREAAAAAAVLGLAGSAELGLPDGRLTRHLDAIAEALRGELLEHRPELLLVTSPLEASSDHRAAFAAVHRVLAGARCGDELERASRGLRVLAYEVNRPLDPDLLVDISGQIETLERAMACYPSQQERHDYLGACLGLAKFRALTLPPEVRAAEAYRRLAVSDFVTRGGARLIAELGGQPRWLTVDEGPSISVIVRTKDRPELLAEALESLAASTYRRAQIVLVNDGGAKPEPPAEFPLPLALVHLAANQGRAAAANAGVAAATGDYVAFLDDDDLVEPEHLETLAGLVGAADVRVAYTDAAVGVYELDAETGWRCVERRLPYSRDFDPELLLFDNYIPFNTLLIERRLFTSVGELDPGFPFFEDWDFLIRLAQRAPFHHLPRVTCEYRHFRDAGHHILGDNPRRRADFLEVKARVLAKHAARRDEATTAAVIDRLRAEAVGEQEEGRRLAGELRRSEERYHRSNGRVASLELHQKVLEQSEGRARTELQQVQQSLWETQQALRETQQAWEEQGSELRRTYGEIERLGELIRAMESTRAWRLHQWWQRQKTGRGAS